MKILLIPIVSLLVAQVSLAECWGGSPAEPAVKGKSALLCLDGYRDEKAAALALRMSQELREKVSIGRDYTYECTRYQTFTLPYRVSAPSIAPGLSGNLLICVTITQE